MAPLPSSCGGLSLPGSLNVTMATAAFWSSLTTPNASGSRDNWWTSSTAPLTRSRRYFCCGTMQRAIYSCRCLRLPRAPKESWPYCLDHRETTMAATAVPLTTPAASLPPAACLVYSFGIANQWEFDDTYADFGCEVHSFDPTGSSMEVHRRHAHPSGRVHFHPWGLTGDVSSSPKCHGASNSDANERLEARRYVGGTYGNLTGPLFSLERIVRRLGHAGRRIDVLKIDCEGCEWDAFYHLATSAAGSRVLSMVDEIYLELHLSLQLSTANDLSKFAAMYQLLFEREGFKLWWVHPNGARGPGQHMHPSLRALPYSRSVWERGPTPENWEVGLRRARPQAFGTPPRACPKRQRRPH
jgi:hypothetical protein